MRIIDQYFGSQIKRYIVGQDLTSESHGTGLGAAAEWVTIVLFAEVARRSFIPLKRQEIYVLFYVASALTGINGAVGVSGGPFGDLIYTGVFFGVYELVKGRREQMTMPLLTP